jgi:hypothetical protein
LEPDIGEKGETDMNKEIVYVDAPEDISEGLMVGEITPDFLPSPEQLERKKVKTSDVLPASLPRQKPRKVKHG